MYGEGFIVNYSIHQNNTKFNKVANLLTKISTSLNWETKIKEPYFVDYEYRFDGSVILIPPTGLPIEVIVNANTYPMEKILERKQYPYSILF